MEWFSRNKAAVAGTALTVLSVVLRFLASDQTPHPTGWDGYYYVMQVHSWITHGYLQSPDFSLIYPFFTVIAWIVGDVILAFKIGIALLSGLLVAVVFGSLVKRNIPLSWVCILCAYLVFSPLTTYFILQFPKNTLGLILLLVCLGSTNRVVMALFFIATIMTHRMTGGLVMIGGAIYALKYIPWKWIVAGIVVVSAISLLPGIIHISDLARLDNQFTAIPHWSPFEFYQIFPNSLSPLFKADLVIVSVLIVTSFYVVIGKRKTMPLTSWILFTIACISIFPFFKFGAGDIGQRFFLIAPVIFIMLMPHVEWNPRIQWATAVVIILLATFSFESYKPNSFDPPNERYRYIVEKLETRYNHLDYPLVIAHNSLAEMIIFSTDFDALNWLPPEDMQPRHVLRLINGVNYPDLRKYLDARDRMKLRPIASGYFALPEDAWQRLVAAATKDNDPRVMAGIFGGSNPMDKRPYYLNKGKIR
jgi:hypothetical protein